MDLMKQAMLASACDGGCYDAEGILACHWIDEDWTGSPHELYRWAAERRWFYIPHKEIEPADLDCHRLIEFYRDYLEWYRSRYPDAAPEAEMSRAFAPDYATEEKEP